MTRPEIYLVTNSYIGVNDGFLGNFTYKTHEEFYPYFCDLDISPSAYEGTTRVKFMQILEKSDPISQVKILKGVIKKYPIDSFLENDRETGYTGISGRVFKRNRTLSCRC